MAPAFGLDQIRSKILYATEKYLFRQLPDLPIRLLCCPDSVTDKANSLARREGGVRGGIVRENV